MSSGLVLVTGGAGFIGSNIVAGFAADRAREVVVCDLLGDAGCGKWRNLAKHPIADLLAPSDLWSWLEGRGKDVDLIVHMGATSSTLENDVDALMANNFGLSRDLFIWCSKHRKRLIYASSAATYGDGSRGFDDGQDFEVMAALRPLNPYGWSKALFDLFAVRQAEAGRAPPQWVGLKFFNVYGPNEEHKEAMRSVVSKIWRDVAAGRPATLFRSHDPTFADGGQQRDFLYVADAAAVVAWFADNPSVSGVYNCGSGVARSFRDVATAVFAALEHEPEIRFVDTPSGLRDRYQYFTRANLKRLRRAGYAAPMTTLEDGVADYVGRFLSQADPHL